jgi:cell division protease FtsH
VAAEELFYGARGISVGSQNDIEKITKMLNLMVGRLSMYSRAKIDYSQMGNDASGEHTLRQVEDTLLDQYVLSKDAVFALLEQHKDALLAGLHQARHASLKLCAEEAAVA